MNGKLYDTKIRRSESYKGNLGCHTSEKPFWKPTVFLPTSKSWNNNHQQSATEKAKWAFQLNRNIIGENETFNGPFGLRKAIYFDYTASGRSIRKIEQFIREHVLPVYGNTHTTTSFFASEISAYREEAREIIHASCGCGIDDEVIFCGSGATAAVHKLVHSIHSPNDPPPLIIIGPFEHHSNILPWKELSNKVIMVPEDSYGKLDMDFLKKTLAKVSSRRSFVGSKRQVIGLFSASSNVTGALTDDVAVTALMHSYEALAIWDYAAAGPHVKISMNPSTHTKELDVLAQKDALFFSGHKFLGGPQTPGVLIAKRHIFRNPVPHGAGGGTVLFVTKRNHKYLKATHEREEGGTPDIIGSIRLGLVFQLKNEISDELIINTEASYARLALREWTKLPQIVILGHHENPRIPIISFLIKHDQSGYFLHHDFVVALLNDLFGIQCRGGCMCAGPYAQDLLGISESLALAYETILSKPKNSPTEFLQEAQYDVVFKPGFTRVSLPYHASIEEVNYLIDAVKFVAIHGWKLLPIYRCSFEDGTFRYKGFQFIAKQKPVRKIESFRFLSRNKEDQFDPHLPISSSPTSMNKQSQSATYLSFKESLDFAETSLIRNIHKILMKETLEDDTKNILPKRKHLRWFLLPSEALEFLRNSKTRLSILETSSSSTTKLPFTPKDNYKSIPSPDNLQRTFIPGSIPYMITSTSKWDDVISIDSSNSKRNETHKNKLREITEHFERSIIASRRKTEDVIPPPSLVNEIAEHSSDEDLLPLPDSPDSSSVPSSGFHDSNFRGSSYF